MMETVKGYTGRARFSLDIRPLQMSSRYQGTGVYCYNLVRQLIGMDEENEYMLFQRGHEPWRELSLPPNFKPFLVRRFYDQDQRFSPLLDQVLTPWDVARARPHLHHALSIHYCCWRLPCPSVVTILDLIPLLFPEDYMKTGLKHRMLYRFARKADHILTISEHAKKDIHRLLGIPLDKITVAYLAADERFRQGKSPEKVEEMARKYGIEGPYILYTGGFTKVDPRKNVEQLIEVYRELRNQGFDKYQLVLAGKLGEYSQELMRKMDQMNMGAGVVFTDHLNHDDLPYLYNGARCFVFPSFYEGFGMPPLEAISCGAPTIAYRNSSLPEVVGDAGILIDEQQPGQLLEAIRTLLARDDLVGELRAKGFEQAKRFRWEDTARKTLAVYREVCARKGRKPNRGG
jgi:glycosyltransferase involved in cell wall biosynthesis